MENRYLFRGKIIKSTDDDSGVGEWVQGFLTKDRMSPDYKDYTPLEYVIDNENEDNGLMYQAFVDPATIGQCTGMKDMDGKLIFEGDILQTQNSDRADAKYTVVWHIHRWGLKEINKDESHSTIFSLFGIEKLSSIVGNIHDNEQ